MLFLFGLLTVAYAQESAQCADSGIGGKRCSFLRYIMHLQTVLGHFVRMIILVSMMEQPPSVVPMIRYRPDLLSLHKFSTVVMGESEVVPKSH